MLSEGQIQDFTTLQTTNLEYQGECQSSLCMSSQVLLEEMAEASGSAPPHLYGWPEQTDDDEGWSVFQGQIELVC